MTSTLTRFDYNGNVISQRITDAWVNLTQMAKANGVRLDNYFANKATTVYLETLARSLESEGSKKTNQEGTSSDVQNPGIEILRVRKGGRKDLQGTWAHPLVAIHFAQWISPEFHLWCNQHIKTLIEKGETKLIPGRSQEYSLVYHQLRDFLKETGAEPHHYIRQAQKENSIIGKIHGREADNLSAMEDCAYVEAMKVSLEVGQKCFKLTRDGKLARKMMLERLEQCRPALEKVRTGTNALRLIG